MNEKPIPRYPRRPMSILMQNDDRGWQVIGILPAPAGAAAASASRELVRDDGTTRIYRWEGMELPLVPDACDDYWFNLISPQPRLYVICQPDAEGAPVPLRITADQDDSVAADEVDEWFFQAAMPAQIVFWIRDYVATHYRPGPRKQKIKGKDKDKYNLTEGRRQP